MAEVIEATVRDANNQIVSEHGFKLAAEPKVTLPTEEGEIEQVIAGQERPQLHDGARNHAADRARRLQADQADAAHQRGRRRRGRGGASPASPSRTSPIRRDAEGEKAAKGDRVTISFAGTIDGKPFEGGSGDDGAVLIGSNTFIPGFEDQLIGIAARRDAHAEGHVPAALQARRQLAGKDAEFVVTAKSIEAPGTVTVDDEFAKSLGLESLAKLRDAVKDRLTREHTAVSRQKVKRALLDELESQA